MLLRVPEVLSPQAVARIRALIETADWSDMRGAAGSIPPTTPTRGSRHLQDDSKVARAASQILVDALSVNPLFFAGALPKKIVPPQFHRHDPIASNPAGSIENAVRLLPAAGIQARIDIAATVFLSDPREYEGGELIIEDHLGSHPLKLRAGDVVLCPASTLTRVQTVTRGTRLSAMFWVESMVRHEEHRRLLYEMDIAITALRARHGDSDELARLSGCYHNLTRLWITT